MGEQQAHDKRSAEWLLLCVVLIWAANYPLAKWAIQVLDVLVFNSLRYITAAGLMAGFFFQRYSWTPMEKRDWRSLLRAGFIASILYQMAFIIGLSMTTAGNSAILLSTSPLWTIFLNAKMHKEKIRPIMWAGMLVSLCGIILIIIGSGKKLEFGSYALFGDLITLTAAILWGLNTNLQKPLLVKYQTAQITMVMLAVGAVGLTAAAVPSSLSMDWTNIHWGYYLAAFVSGAFSIAAANLFWSFGVKQLGPARTANFNNLVPVIAFVISYFVLKEQVYLIHFIGAAVTIFGVWLARR